MSYWSASEIATPLLGQGGVDAPSRKWSPSSEGAAGVVRSTTDNRWLEPTTPSAPAKEASRHFLDGRSISLCFALSGSRFAPSLAKEGSSRRRAMAFQFFGLQPEPRHLASGPVRILGTAI